MGGEPIEPASARSLDPRSRHLSVRAVWLLGAIVLLAAAIRAATLDFGLPALNDQDELIFELAAMRMLRGATFNPGWFGHPATTTIYLLAAINAGVFLAGRAAGWFTGPAQFVHALYHDPGWAILPGRAGMLVFGVLTVVLTYRLGRRLCGTRTGLLAALLLAIDPLHVAYSQIIRSDMMACAFLLLAMLAALRFADGGGRRAAVAAGAWTGVAIATKWPFALAFAALIGGAAHRWRTGADPPRRLIADVALAGVASVAALLATSPFLAIDWRTVVSNLDAEKQPHHLGATGGSFAANVWWYLSQPVAGALGPAGLALAGAGCVLVWRDPRARAILAPVTLAFVALISAQAIVWPRWALALLPPLAIAAGQAAARLSRAAERRWHARAGALTLVALGLATLPPLAWSTWADGRERMNDTRQQATGWVRRHVPPGRTVMIEHFAWDLLDGPYRLEWPIAEAGCVDPRGFVTNQALYQSIDVLRAGRSNIDYGTLAKSRRASCRPDVAILSQYDRYAAERDRFPAEYANYRALLAHARTLAVFAPERGEAGGWTVRVVGFDRSGAAAR